MVEARWHDVENDEIWPARISKRVGLDNVPTLILISTVLHKRKLKVT